MRFAALGDLVQSVAREGLEALAAPLRDALRAVLLDISRDPASLGVLALLKRLTSDRPVVIAMYDMQWLDEATTEVFRFASDDWVRIPCSCCRSRTWRKVLPRFIRGWSVTTESCRDLVVSAPDWPGQMTYGGSWIENASGMRGTS